MGEVLHVDFGKRKKIENNQPKEEEPAGELESKEELGKDTTSINLNFLQFSLSEDAKKLMRLTVSPSSLQKSREIVKNYETSELFEWLEGTNKNDWEKKAAFFQAIFIELKSRIIKK